MNCETALMVAGPCMACNQPLDPVHIITDDGGMRLYCDKCCPIHMPIVEKVWECEAVIVNGELSTTEFTEWGRLDPAPLGNEIEDLEPGG